MIASDFPYFHNGSEEKKKKKKKNGSEASGVSRDGHYQGLMTQNGVEFSWIFLEMIIKYIQISLSGKHFCLFVSFFLPLKSMSIITFVFEEYESEVFLVLSDQFFN